VFFNPVTATHADEPSYLRAWGILFGGIQLAGYAFYFHDGFPSWAWVFIALLCYGGGWVAGWLMWGLFFEPYADMNAKRKNAA
jgi:hypothetical protein